MISHCYHEVNLVVNRFAKFDIPSELSFVLINLLQKLSDVLYISSVGIAWPRIVKV